jgi:hypothetical protein
MPATEFPPPGPYKDLVAGLQYILVEHPEIDRERLTALGASYGGGIRESRRPRNLAQTISPFRLHDQLAARA